MVMKKILPFLTVVLMAGVVMYGSGSIVALNTTEIQTVQKYGVIQFGMENNASFLAPMPINIHITPMCLDEINYSQTFRDGYLLSPRAICNN